MTAPASPAALPHRLAGLDGIRAISILLVLVAHAGFGRAVPGGLGVSLFFFVSGFLITGQLAAEHARCGRIALPAFWGRRALRLLPASTVYLIVAGGTFVLLGGGVSPAAWLGTLLHGANLLEVFTRLLDTDLAHTPHPFSILWSLAIEEHFYLVWPVLLACLAAPGLRPALLCTLVAAILLTLAWRIELRHLCTIDPARLACGLHADDRIYKSTDTRLDLMAWGALAALVSPRGEPASGVPARSVPIALAVAALLASVLVRDAWFRDTLRYSLIGAACLVLVPPLTRRGPIAAALEWPPLVAIGRLSYSLYLWHWFALMLCRHWSLAGPAFVATYAALGAGFALLSWHAIERPMLALRRRAGSHAPQRLVPAPRPSGRRTISMPGLGPALDAR